MEMKEKKSIVNPIVKKTIVVATITIIIGYLAGKVLITTLLMVVSVMTSSLLRAAYKKETFKWTIVFHKGCATIHGAFVSFYLFSYNSLRTDFRFSPIEMFMFILLASFVLSVFGGLMARKVLDNENPGFLEDKEERENAWLATLSLAVALLFARVLIQNPSTSKVKPSISSDVPACLSCAALKGRCG